MSRIDKALEIAAQKRKAADSGKRSEVEPEVGAREDDLGARTAALSPRTAMPVLQPKVPIHGADNPFLVAAHSAGNGASEQYRKLKSSLVKLSQLGRFENSLMVTSAVGGEGKTLTSLNLAITLAQEYDHTVLLVEADIRSPSVLKYLGMQAEMGLTDCILDGVDVGEVLIKTDIGNLTILPAGRMVPNPVELFSSKKMQDLLEEIKNRYANRYIIVDTTPLLPFAEPQYIANVVDGVLLVVREGYTSMDKLNKSLGLLKNHNLLGVICNAVRQTKEYKYGYYGYYGYKDN
ncbi:MAG: XrtA-associated tyrosine autokinase [Desulfuromonas sp.]|nr:XrtA-associated tyrosine autokinase [Desulfuromonas sp.]